MAAPAPTARQTPTGIKLKEGYQVLIAFASNPTVNFWEKTVKPPGVDGGDKIDQTTQHNVAYKTNAPQYLLDITDSSSKVAYDPAVWDDIIDLVNVPDTITIHFPDGSTLAFFGYLKSFEPDDMSMGNQPEATISIVVTNIDPITCTEQGPVLTAGNGSCFAV